ncbi:hypothetical protein JMN32_03610 [Fulvivirga sp. 29W222]|uniref:Uncharacterized protein n=1 Tax=Fulvivirga marina TaxID=2494733 RepID=A0A937FUS2_9BACT|nr:hypothetical protein [Fulvivirga marina]MBL6445378.1 hypothetical protein [Fulvivirga marina]
MKSTLLIVILVSFQMCTIAQVADSCYQKTQSKSDVEKLEPIMCIPNGYYIVDVYEEDLNADGRVDKVTEWFKEKLNNGDTTFHSVYFQMRDSSFSHFATYDNLTQLYFDLHSQSTDVMLEDSILNEIKFKYQSYGDLPTFYNGGFSVEFYTDAAGYKRLFFEFSNGRSDFVLRKEQDWLAPQTSTWTEGEQLEEEVIYSEEEGISVKNFKILEYLE